MKKWLLLLPLLYLPANAAIIASDNFDSLASTQLSSAPSGWTQTNGTVDWLTNGFAGLPCRGGSGGCVDLDGSTADAGDLTFNTLFTLTPGNLYTLTYWLAGSQRGDSNTVTVSFAGNSQQHTLSSSQGYTQFSLALNPANVLNNVQIVFSHEGGDNLGLLLDDVTLDETPVTSTSSVPEPGSALLGLIGAGALAALRRFRR